MKERERGRKGRRSKKKRDTNRRTKVSSSTWFDESPVFNPSSRRSLPFLDVELTDLFAALSAKIETTRSTAEVQGGTGWILVGDGNREEGGA